jgi:hypothetical protein
MSTSALSPARASQSLPKRSGGSFSASRNATRPSDSPNADPPHVRLPRLRADRLQPARTQPLHTPSQTTQAHRHLHTQRSQDPSNRNRLRHLRQTIHRPQRSTRRRPHHSKSERRKRRHHQPPTSTPILQRTTRPSHEMVTGGHPTDAPSHGYPARFLAVCTGSTRDGGE